MCESFIREDKKIVTALEMYSTTSTNEKGRYDRRPLKEKIKMVYELATNAHMQKPKKAYTKARITSQEDALWAQTTCEGDHSQ